MDFVRLGERYTSAYIPDLLIEGYNSLVWTERFGTPGEFELKTFDIDNMRALLPEDTLVSHLETKEVMQVETLSEEMVGEGDDAQPELTIKGRSATIILNHRWVESKYQKKRRMRKKYSATSAAAVLINQAVDNASGSDITRGDDDKETEGVINNYPWNTKDVLPNVAVTENVAAEGETRWWMLEQGMLLPQLEKILNNQDLSVRCLRPVYPSPAKVVTVKVALDERGTVVRTDKDDVPQLQFQIFDGHDRTSGNGAVKLSLLQGHLDKPEYLNSYADYKTEMEVMSAEVEISDIYRDGDAGKAGWQRRSEGFDAGDPEIPPEPTKPDDLGRNPTASERNAYHDRMDTWRTKMGKWRNKRDNIIADFREESRKAALGELKRRRKINMFSGQMSSLAPFTYKTHYDLGDTILIYDKTGREAKMLVAEYVRTENADGDFGFPGLVEPTG
jgi:hypothetical protein